MRPKHWLKNVLIFIPIVFSKRLFEPATFGKTVGAFFVFSLLSSAIYIFNDIRDVESDRRHDVKKSRPIAAGRVSIPSAYVQFLILAVAAVLLNGFICGPDVKCFALMFAYFVANISYSLGLKNIPFVDISLLVSGFMVRVHYGAAVIGDTVSHWVSLTVIALSFYLGLGKRRNEIVKSDGKADNRKVLRFYSFHFLDKFMYVCLPISIVFYALWSADAATVEKLHTDKLIWTVPLVVILMMKYSSDSSPIPTEILWM